MAVLVWMDWRLALVAFSVLPLIVLVTQWFRRNVRESYRTVRTWIARINAFLQERITGMATVQLFRREARDFAAFDEIDRAHRDANVDSIFYYAVFYPAIELVSALAASLIIWVGGGWVLQDAADARLARGVPAVLAAVLPADQRHVGEVQHAAGRDGVVRAHLRAARHAGGDDVADGSDAWHAPSIRRRPASGRPAGSVRPDRVRARHVRLRRGRAGAEGRLVRGASRASASRIVGATGSGKTTIVNLLLRFYDVQQGRITIDGVDIREMDLRRSCGACSASCCRTSTCSRARSPTTSGWATRRSATRRCAAPSTRCMPSAFIDRLPRGLETPVAERGATLSVGQKQLLSFARALAFDPRVLILDEATSSVDTETELLIRDALKVVMRGRTTIAIAHRLSTIQDMDRILVLHKGELRESGTHQELLAARGIYHRLYQLQFKDKDRTAGTRSAD